MYCLSVPNPTLSTCSVLMELGPASISLLSSGIMLSFVLEALQPLQEKGFSSWLWCAHLVGSCSAWFLRLQPHRNTQLIFMGSFLQYPRGRFSNASLLWEVFQPLPQCGSFPWKLPSAPKRNAFQWIPSAWNVSGLPHPVSHGCSSSNKVWILAWWKKVRVRTSYRFIPSLGALQ